jgi:Holliday junction resolvase RusA-like endonuclease
MSALFRALVRDFELHPYVRITQNKRALRIPRNRITDPSVLRSLDYLENREALAWHFKAERLRTGLKTITAPCRISWTVHITTGRAGDRDNYCKAISDALETSGVVENDRLIEGCGSCRIWKKAPRAMVALILEEL